eukprot:1145076-Pelagomonas_calceolata.AAC.5
MCAVGRSRSTLLWDVETWCIAVSTMIGTRSSRPVASCTCVPSGGKNFTGGWIGLLDEGKTPNVQQQGLLLHLTALAANSKRAASHAKR